MGMINAVKMVNDAVRFAVELGALAALCYWGWFLAPGPALLQYLLCMAAPLVFITIWGLFLSPRARIPAKGVVRLVMEFGYFGLAALALWTAGRPGFALLLAGLYAINWVMLLMFGQWNFDQGSGHE
jgi:hypothetical protein